MSSCAGKPEAFFVVPDPFTPEVYSASSQAGTYPGLTTSTTPGQLIPMQSGSSLVSGVAETYDYRIVRAGGTGTAEFVWRNADNAANPYLGKDDIRNWWGTHCPVAVSPFVRNNSIMFHAPSRRIYVCGAPLSSTSVAIYYRNVDTDRFDSFTSAYTITLRQAMHSSDSSGLAMVSLYDGTCLLIARNTAANDFDVYRSTDPTTNNWSLISRNILSRFLGGTVAQGTRSQIRVASSGDFIRLSFVAPAVGTSCTLYTMVSQDRGATWTSTSTRTLDAISAGVLTDDYCPFDICGVGDSGTFVLGYHFYNVALVSNFLVVVSASGSGNWAAAGSATIVPKTLRQVVVVSNESSVYAFGLWSDLTTAALDGWMMGQSPTSTVAATNSGWEFSPSTSMNGYDGMDLLPGRVKAVWCGNGWYFYGCTRSESTGAAQTNGFGWYAGTWTKRSLGAFGPSQTPASMTTPMLGIIWAYNYGKPSDGAGTVWTRTVAGTGADTLVSEGLSMSQTTVGSGIYYSHAEPTIGTWYTSGGVWLFAIRLGTTSGANADHRILVQMSNAASTDGRAFTVRVDATTITLADSFSASTAQITGLTVNTGSSGAFHIVRVSVGAGGTNCCVEVLSTATNTWYQSSAINLTASGSGGLTPVVRFGIFNQTVAGTQQSWWRDFACSTNGSLLNRQSINMVDADASNATNLLFGEVCQPVPQYLEYGLYLSWSGLYGTENDSWAGTMAYTFPKEAVLVDSPRIVWRTDDVATTGQVVLYIGDSVDRFFHNAIALFGCNNRYALMDYDNNAAFSSPSATQTVDFTAYGTGVTPLTVSALTGNAMEISGSSFKFTTGELVGCYVRMTSGSAIGKTFKITRHPLTNRIHFDGETTTLSAQLVNVGNQFVIFTSFGVLKYSATSGAETYMRIRLADTDTAEGYHQLGTIVAGVSIDVDVPMDWAHTDNEQPNVTSYRTKSGIAWAFQEGPSQRTIEGRVVGDAERWREKFRNMMRQIGYEGKACALVLNADQTPETLMLGRVKSGASLDQAGWYRDSFGIMRTAGDLSLTFVEEK